MTILSLSEWYVHGSVSIRSFKRTSPQTDEDFSVLGDRMLRPCWLTISIQLSAIVMTALHILQGHNGAGPENYEWTPSEFAQLMKVCALIANQIAFAKMIKFTWLSMIFYMISIWYVGEQQWIILGTDRSSIGLQR